MKIKHEMNLDLENFKDLGGHRIVIEDLSSEEFDYVIGLFYSIFNYPDFINKKEIISQVSLKSISSSILAQSKKD